MNDKEFIDEITHTLYQRLDAKTAMFDALKVLKLKFPVDNFHVGIFNRKKHELRYFAYATAEGGILIDERVKLNSKGKKELSRFPLNKATITNRNHESPIISGVFEKHERIFKNSIFKDSHPISTLTLTPDISQEFSGCFSIVVKGVDMYTKKDAALFEKLSRPLIGSIINLINHLDILNKNKILSKLNRVLSKKLGHEEHELIGKNNGLKDVDFLVNQVAPLSSPVMIFGETGTGKELIAHEVHKRSLRYEKPMICVNCGAIPENLIETELFGYEKGAFTGASSRKRGYFEQADKGTIFLDELGELSLSAQVKLLRILQEKKFRRVGGDIEVSVDVRIIAATNSDLKEMIDEKKFREDLYFRLNVFPIHVPPLRARKIDIPRLVEYFLEKKSNEFNFAKTPNLENGAINTLLNYHWPGNIRELMNLIERKLIIYNNEEISFNELNEPKQIFMETREEVSFKTLDETIIDHIKKGLKKSDGKIEGKGMAAELLGLNPSTLRGKLRKYKIDPKNMG